MYQPSLGEQKAIEIVKNELSEWGDGIVFVTDRVAFDMGETIKKARKNFFGIFDEEKNPITQRKKLWVPFTEWTVETVLKNIDIDTKDIDVKAKNQESYITASILRYVLRYYFEKLELGKKINLLLRNTVIDGTAFIKTWVEKGKVKIRIVDRMNMIVDPSAPDLTDTPVIERNLLTISEFQEYDWDNMDSVEGIKSLDRTGMDAFNMSNVNTEVPYVEVYERYGYLPKFCFTEKEADKEEYVYAKVCYSTKGTGYIVHRMEEVSEHPYQEFKYKDVLNRFDGRGVPEMLFPVQAYLNETVNTRLETARVAQAGLWEVRGNITPQQLKRLFTTGAIKTTAEGDITRIDTGTIDPSSYQDEDRAYLWGQRQTQTLYEDEMSANKPATNALIQERGTSKAYNLIIEGFALNLQKWLKDKLIPAISKTIKKTEIVRITGDVKSLEKIDEHLVENYVNTKIAEMKETPMGKMQLEQAVFDFINQGVPLEQAEQQVIEGMKQGLMQDLQKTGKDRFPEISKEMFDTDYDVQVSIGDEQINKAVMANILNQAIGMMGKVGLPIIEPLRELFDTLGLDGARLTESIERAQQAQQMALPQPQATEVGAMPMEGGMTQAINA